VLRQEKHSQAHAIHGPDAEQPVGDLRQDACAITGAIIGCRAAMGESSDLGERHLEDVRRARAVGARHEADAAGIALAPGVEQTKRPLQVWSGPASVWWLGHA